MFDGISKIKIALKILLKFYINCVLRNIIRSYKNNMMIIYYL